MGKHEDSCVFDLCIRKNPFNGEFTIFAGLSAVLTFLKNFKISAEDLKFLRYIMLQNKDDIEDEFFEWLGSLTLSGVKVYSLEEGSITFPQIPFLRVEGPLAICQIIETRLLNFINFASLITTNAVRYRLAAGPNKLLLEFGIRRAQGPDGALSASRYSYLGGFDSTSNVKASQAYGINVAGTHAHSFVSSFVDLKDLKVKELFNKNTNKVEDFSRCVFDYIEKLDSNEDRNDGELAAFIAYAISWPTSFIALVDTYDAIKSGLINFAAVALALQDFGYNPVGVRLDSGDLAYLSIKTRSYYKEIEKKLGRKGFSSLVICASNEINENILQSLKDQGHEIDVFGIGTNLVTCQNQTALGGVYKLVEYKGAPRLKLTHEISKLTIPGRKEAYRLYDSNDLPMLDLIIAVGDRVPRVGEKVMCRHPFIESTKVFVIPSRVEPLHSLVWDGGIMEPIAPPAKIRQRIISELQKMRKDHLRFMNPTPYKVSLSEELYSTFNSLQKKAFPISFIK